MEPPPAVLVNGIPVPLEVDPTIEEQGTFEWSPDHAGVKLRGLSTDLEWSTLLHELLHAIEEFSGIDLSEEDVRALEYGLWGLFRNNPDLMLRWALVAAGRAPTTGPTDAPH